MDQAINSAKTSMRIFSRRLQVFICLLTLSGISWLAAPSASEAQTCNPIVVAGSQSQELPPMAGDWTPAERWAWQQVRRTGVADFDALCGRLLIEAGKHLSSDPPDETRKVRAQFLHHLLSDDIAAKSLPHRAVQLKGAWINTPVDLRGLRSKTSVFIVDSLWDSDLHLDGARIDGTLTLTGSVFRAPVSLPGARIDGAVNLSASRFEREVQASGLYTKESVWLTGSVFLQKVDLIAVEIGDDLIADSTVFHHNLDLNSLRTGYGALLTTASVGGALRLWNARIGTLLDFRGTRFDGIVDLGGVRTGADVYLDCATYAEQLRLSAMDVGGTLHLNSSTIEGDVQADGLRSRGSVFLGRNPDRKEAFRSEDCRVRFAGPGFNRARTHSVVEGETSFIEVRIGGTVEMSGVSLGKTLFLGARIDGSFNARGARFTGPLDLGGAQIGGALSLEEAHFAEQLFLNGANIGSDMTIGGGHLPSEVGIIGLRFDRIFWPSAPDRTRTGEQWAEFLQLQKPYAPQPYQQLASALRRMGYSDDATAILYHNSKRNWIVRYIPEGDRPDRKLGIAAWTNALWQGAPESLLYGAYGLLVGYGLYPHWAIWACIIFVALGVAVLWVTGDRAKNKMWTGISYSLDRFLPVIDLRKDAKDVHLSSCSRAYFYIHRIVGFILAVFIIAALSGLVPTGSNLAP